MSREECITRLLELPAEIQVAELSLLAIEEILGRAKERLEDKKGVLLTADPPVIDGKNEASRAAQLREYTTKDRRAVAEAEECTARERIALRHVQNEFSALRSVARLLGGGEL